MFISLDRWNDNGGWRRSWKCLKVEMVKNQYSKDNNDILHQADEVDDFFFNSVVIKYISRVLLGII